MIVSAVVGCADCSADCADYYGGDSDGKRTKRRVQTSLSSMTTMPTMRSAKKIILITLIIDFSILCFFREKKMKK